MIDESRKNDVEMVYGIWLIPKLKWLHNTFQLIMLPKFITFRLHVVFSILKKNQAQNKYNLLDISFK